MKKRFLGGSIAISGGLLSTALSLVASPAFAITPSSDLANFTSILDPEELVQITFGEFTPPDNSSQFNVTDQYQAQGITLSNWYRYLDGRDTNDQVGISVGLVPGTTLLEIGLIEFLQPVKNLEIEWWTIVGDLNITAFDSSGTLLGSLNNLSGGNTVSSIAGDQISKLQVEGLGGFGQITTLKFEQSTEKPIPEPTTTLLISSLVLGGGSCFKRKGLKPKAALDQK